VSASLYKTIAPGRATTSVKDKAFSNQNKEVAEIRGNFTPLSNSLNSLNSLKLHLALLVSPKLRAPSILPMARQFRETP